MLASKFSIIKISHITILLFLLLFVHPTYSQNNSDVPEFLVGINNTTTCPYIIKIKDDDTNEIIYVDTLKSNFYTIVRIKKQKPYVLEMTSLNDCDPDCITGNNTYLYEIRRLKGHKGDNEQKLYIRPGWFFYIRPPVCVRL